MPDHPFADLAGTWRGAGHGSYPTIEPFDYREELVLDLVPGRPIARWQSKTADAASGEPRHAESGFLRMTPAGLELVLAHSFGIVETAIGSLTDGKLRVQSVGMLGTPTAKEVDDVVRSYTFAGNELEYTIGMAAVGVSHTGHLDATLRREAG